LLPRARACQRVFTILSLISIYITIINYNIGGIIKLSIKNSWPSFSLYVQYSGFCIINACCCRRRQCLDKFYGGFD
jgi:hypothetical protein